MELLSLIHLLSLVDVLSLIELLSLIDLPSLIELMSLGDLLSPVHGAIEHIGCSKCAPPLVPVDSPCRLQNLPFALILWERRLSGTLNHFIQVPLFPDQQLPAQLEDLTLLRRRAKCQVLS